MGTNRYDNSIKTFFALLRAGLWADTNLDVNLNPNDYIDWEKVYQLAEEQSVIGFVLAGIEHSNVKPPQEFLLQWIGEVQVIEQRNKEMNAFIAELIEKLRKADIYALLVKGQGIAQCYEKPLWRCSGDVDLLLSYDNYQKAKTLLTPLASEVEIEYKGFKHLGMTIDGWIIELHGSLRVGLANRINRELDDIQTDTFCRGNVSSWNNDGTQIFMLGKENDIVYLFVHFLNHFYKGGVGLRQICDWCRLLWKHRYVIDEKKIESRIRKMGLTSEWRAFAAFAVEYLGMPMESMPLYSPDAKWKRKADMICSFIIEVGNLGHNRDMSYFEKYPYLIQKIYSMGRRFNDLIRHARIFPLDSLRFFPTILFNGLRSAVRGEG